MRIKSIEILGDNFRSLSSNYKYEFDASQKEHRLSTKVLAGLNGSGKSNFLELFAEIFYFLECYHMSSVSQEYKQNANIGFIIEYYLPITKEVVIQLDLSERNKDQEVLVRIIKYLNEKPEFNVATLDTDYTNYLRIDKEKYTKKLLPTKIVAYSSGQNELLSNSFYKSRFQHFQELIKGKKNTSGKKEKEEKESEEQSSMSRLFFLDYSSNFYVFIANMLLSKGDNLKLFKDVLGVKDLESFRITLIFNDLNNKRIKIETVLEEKISWLTRCATTWFRDEKTNLLVLDYKVNSATKEAFEYYFQKASNLFEFFYELDFLNLHTIKKEIRDTIPHQHKSYNILDEMPRVDPSDLIFRIGKIRMDKIIDRKNRITKPIYYKSLSDGEHQFNEVVGSVLMMEDSGCLFLMDEPDTHFNPKWRAKFIHILNQISAINRDLDKNVKEVRKQEVILTTHSPFIISDSYKEDVYKFRNGKFQTPKMETYGASIGFILELIFDRDISISDFSNHELKNIRKNIKTLEDIDEAIDKLSRFGESIEKFDVYSYLRIKEKEIRDKE